MNEFKIGDYVKLPAGSVIYLSANWLSVSTIEPIVLQLRHSVGGTPCWGHIQTVIFYEFRDKPNCEVLFEIKDAQALEPKDYPINPYKLTMVYQPDSTDDKNKKDGK